MINIQLTDKPFWQNDVEGYVFLVKEGIIPLASNNDFEILENNYYHNLKDILNKHNFTGKKGQIFILSPSIDGKLKQFIFVGVGNLDTAWNYELENLRRAIGSVILKLKDLQIIDSVISMPENGKPFGLTEDKVLRQLVTIAIMSDYEFVKFKSDKKDKDPWSGKFLICAENNDLNKLALQEGKILGESINTTRGFADLPANHLTPKSLALDAKKIAEKYNLDFDVFGRAKAEELGMGGFCAVDAGSDEEGQFVTLEYKASDNVPTIALVGKGVTFDSGGISLKPSAYMEGMKFDMSGAAAVIGAMQAIAQLKPNVNVIAVTPLVENMPSGKACKQDDIITFLNGKTAEIKNTDAEGRLILADALSFAEKFYKPEVIIDVATLTGACLYALGHFFTALMTKNEDIGAKLQAVGLVTGDRVWPLPLDEDFKDAIKSDVADIANTGALNYKAGTITAGCFLKNFVDKAKYAHLDIAGTADGVPGISYLGKGATGAGVRLLTEFVLNYNKNK
jgi:leucyl aminopeptidase